MKPTAHDSAILAPRRFKGASQVLLSIMGSRQSAVQVSRCHACDAPMHMHGLDGRVFM